MGLIERRIGLLFAAFLVLLAIGGTKAAWLGVVKAGSLQRAASVQQTADITWLPPTAQNLAKLTVPIPAGFRKVSLSAVAAPTFKQISPALLPRPRAFCLMPAVNACGNPPFPVGGPPLGSGYR